MHVPAVSRALASKAVCHTDSSDPAVLVQLYGSTRSNGTSSSMRFLLLYYSNMNSTAVRVLRNFLSAGTGNPVLYR